MRSHQESLDELFSYLSIQISELIRHHLLLTRIEISTKIARVGGDLSRVVVGAVLATSGLLTLIAALVLGITALGVPPWVSATVVGMGLALSGYLLIQQALKSLRREELTPRARIETVNASTA